MPDGTDKWIVSMTTGMALTVVGVTALETAAWFVQYAVLGAGVILSAFALYQSKAELSGA